MISTRFLKQKQNQNQEPSQATYSISSNTNTIKQVPQYFTYDDDLGEEVVCATPPVPTRSSTYVQQQQPLVQQQQPLVQQQQPLVQQQRPLVQQQQPLVQQQQQEPVKIKANKSSRKNGKKTGTKDKENELLKKQLEQLKSEFAKFAAAAEDVESVNNDSDDEDSFDITSIWKWVKNLMSYRLYKSTDVIQMRSELSKHKALCEEMCQKSNFWKGKICHFLETGQQDWRISDKYFVDLGHKNKQMLGN